MEFHINPHQFLYAVTFNGFFAAPVFVGNDEFAELRAPVAQMVYADTMIAQLFINFINGVADYSRTQMADMKGLCDIRGGIVDNDGFAFANIAFAIVFFFRQYAAQYLLGIYAFIQKKVYISPNDFHFRKKGGLFQFCNQFLCNQRRSLAKGFCQTKTGESVIPHCLIGRHFHSCYGILRGNSGGICQ